jgi:hypothetical protein
MTTRRRRPDNSTVILRKVSDQKRIGKNDNSSWWQDNSAVIIAVLSVAVVAMRLLSVSRGDTETAYAILQAGGTGSVLVATLISSLGLLAIPTCAALGLYAADAWDTRHTAARFSLSLAGSLGLLYIVFYTAPFGLLTLSIGFALFMYLVWLSVPKRRKNHSRTFFRPKTFLIIGVCVYILFTLGYELGSPTPWLPVQKITIAGHRAFTGYVLSQGNGQTAILTSKPEGLIYPPTQSSLHATQCTPPYYLEEQATLVDLWERYVRHKLINYPPCPSAPYS